MAFLSGETLQTRKAEFFPNGECGAIDCSAFALRMGPEAVITNDSRRKTGNEIKKKLGVKEEFVIPPGQYAFLLTKEFVSVPADCVAFISLKTTYKFKGLINASGFHVDPGWHGRLIFTVYNAGTSTVAIAEGDPLFLIWYSELDQTTKLTYVGKAKGQDRIGSELVERATGQVYSPQTIAARMQDLEAGFKKISNWFWWVFVPIAIVIVAAILPVILGAAFGNWSRLFIGESLSQQSSSVETEMRVDSQVQQNLIQPDKDLETSWQSDRSAGTAATTEVESTVETQESE